MKKINIFAMLLSLACSCGVVSCNDDDDLKPALQSPVVTETAGAYNSLSFEWNDVPDAVQYGYRLSDTDGIAVNAGVTYEKSVTITDLQPATTYTLQVWAFASMDGDYSTPPAVTLTATTDPLIKLNTPVGLELASQNGCSYTATWNAVENASEYVYVVSDAEGNTVLNGTTSDASVLLNGLESGDYTFTVYAEGHGGYERGDAVSAAFTVDKPAEPIYTVRGTYYSDQLGESWPATMEAYADGSYSIKAFYGVEGYNLDFKVNESDADDMFEILNGSQVVTDVNGVDYYTWQVPTGLSDPSVLDSYPWYNYSYFEGDRTEGEVGIGNYYNNYSWGYDVFTWGGTSGSIVDDLVGTYDCHFTGWDYYITGDGETAWDDTWTEYATVSKVDDVTVSIDGLFYTDEPVLGVVDSDNLTITLDLRPDYLDWYIVASDENYDVPAVATIESDGSITLANWALWYNYGTDSAPEWYTYLEGTSVLSPSYGVASKPHRLADPKSRKVKKASVGKSGKLAPVKASKARKPVSKHIH